MSQDFTDRLAKAGTILTDQATIEALVAEVERLRRENAELRAQAAEWERLPELLQAAEEKGEQEAYKIVMPLCMLGARAIVLMPLAEKWQAADSDLYLAIGAMIEAAMAFLRKKID